MAVAIYQMERTLVTPSYAVSSRAMVKLIAWAGAAWATATTAILAAAY